MPPAISWRGHKNENPTGEWGDIFSHKTPMKIQREIKISSGEILYDECYLG
jgi:hypothetical protein